MQLLFAFASDHFWNAAIVASIVAFMIGVYGHVIHSRVVVAGSIAAIGAILVFFVISGELTSGGAGPGFL